MDKHIICNVQQQPNLFNNLFIILQAIQCQITSRFCNHLKCPELLSIVFHIRNCEDASDCTFPKCIQTISHMKHYLNCSKKACVCFKFGPKSTENKLFLNTRQILLRNQFLIWRRKFKPFRPHLLSILSNYVTNLTDISYKKSIYDELKNFDDQNFEKARGMSTYLTNFSQNVNSIMSKTMIKHIQSSNPSMSFQDCLEKIDESSNLIKIYNYLKNYSTDVLHDKIKLLEPGPVEEEHKFVPKVEPALMITVKDEPKHEEVKVEPSPFAESVVEENSPPPSPEPEPEPIWSGEEIRDLFMPMHRRLCREKEFEIFLKPVDWKSLDIPDYPRIITHPMDLSTIGTKLQAATEYQDPWQPISDYWLMFDNAWTYNKKSSRVYKMCSSAARMFGELADELMRSLGLCCGRQYVYEPQVLICCTPNMCMVTRDAGYYALDNRDTEAAAAASGTGLDDHEHDSSASTLAMCRPVPELANDKYVCCDKCYQDSGSADSVQLMVSELTSTLVSVPKALLVKLKNNVKEPEDFTECRKCRRRWHRVCAHHIDEVWPSGFHCPGCEAHRVCPKQRNVLTSSQLPECALSRHLEQRISAWISATGTGAGKIVVRVLSDCPKQVDIKPEMRRAYVETGEMPEALPYRLKAIFAFQQQQRGGDGVHDDAGEICLFGMHCQEYGPDCPGANARRVYLAYLDSVQYFEPAALRTEFYHRVLTAYLEFCRDAGFLWAHIWACPPGDGDDYIFHMHPPSQKVPKPKRLQEWYIAMLDRAIHEGVIIDYCDIFAFSYNSQLTSLAEVPYFEGDYWPTIMEDLLKEDAVAAAAAMETGAGFGSTLGLAVAATKSGSLVQDEWGDRDHNGALSNGVLGGAGSVSKKRKHKKPSNGATCGPSQSKRRRHSAPAEQAASDPPVANGNNDTMKRLFELMEKRKDNFFVVRLLDSVPDTVAMGDSDTDTGRMSVGSGSASGVAPASGADLMDGRDKFLCLSRDKHLEFSSWRRARFATLVLCYELHLEARHGVICSCNRCDLLLLDPATVRYECARCHEYEVCETCASVPGVHRHALHRVEPPSATAMATTTTVTSLPAAAVVANDNSTTRTVTTATSNSGGEQQQGAPTTSDGDQTAMATAARAPASRAAAAAAVIDDATRLRNLVLATELLEHAFRCRDACCRTPNCAQWRGFVLHMRSCTLGAASASVANGNNNRQSSCRTCTRLAPLVAMHHRKYGNNNTAGGGGYGNNNNGSGISGGGMSLVANGNNQQARLWQLQSERRRMQSATIAMAQSAAVAAAVPTGTGTPQALVPVANGNRVVQPVPATTPAQQHQHQQPINSGSGHGDGDNYSRDLNAIRAYLSRLREGGASPQEVSRTFSQFLATSPRYMLTWRRYQSEMQRHNQQHQQQQHQAVANTVVMTTAAAVGDQTAVTHHHGQQYHQHQQQYQQQNHHANYRPMQHSVAHGTGQSQQFYVVQARQPMQQQQQQPHHHHHQQQLRSPSPSQLSSHGYIANVVNCGPMPNFQTSPSRFTFSPSNTHHQGYVPIFNPSQPPPPSTPSPSPHPHPRVFYHPSQHHPPAAVAMATAPAAGSPVANNTHYPTNTNANNYHNHYNSAS